VSASTGFKPKPAIAVRIRRFAQTTGSAVLVQVVLWTVLVKLGLIIGGAQGAAIQYLVNR
jgi:hypothetical protein